MAHHINAVNQMLYKYVTRICNKQCRRRVSAFIVLFTWNTHRHTLTHKKKRNKNQRRTFVIDIPEEMDA